MCKAIKSEAGRFINFEYGQNYNPNPLADVQATCLAIHFFLLITFHSTQNSRRSSNLPNVVQVLGTGVWTVISNVTEPLAILFYFHSVGCLADVIHHSFTDKYVGLLSEQTCGTTDGTVDDAPETLVLVRSTSSALLRQSSRSVAVQGQRNSASALSRVSSANSVSFRLPRSTTNMTITEETF